MTFWSHERTRISMQTDEVATHGARGSFDVSAPIAEERAGKVRPQLTIQPQPQTRNNNSSRRT